MSSHHSNSAQESTFSSDSVNKETQGASRGSKGSLLVGLLAGLSASACCAGPLILLTLGISGSWIGNLSALEPFRPYFIALAIIFVGLAYRKIYLPAKPCDVDAVCATDVGDRSQKVIFWVTTIIVVLSIAFPWYAPLFLD